MTAVKPLTKKETKILRCILEEQKDKLIFRNRQFDGLNFDEEDRSDEVDQANADYSNAQLLRFRNRDNFYEKKIDEAILRIKKGEYGLCKECDGPIRFARLRARPTAEQCITCKEESERIENHNFFGRQSKSRGRALELTTRN